MTTMRTIKGPAIFLAQFAGDTPPYDSLPALARWAAGHGYKGVQIPSWDARLFDLARAADSRTYCDEVKGTLQDAGLALTELSTHLQGQLVAVHPAYDLAFDGFAPAQVRGNPAARQAWATDQPAAGGEGVRQPRPDRPRHLLRQPGMAVRLPLAATPARPDRDRLQ